jgi:hypothetical protein
MDLSTFISNVASNFRTRYIDLAQQFQRPETKSTPTPTLAAEPVAAKPETAIPVDEYIPAATTAPTTTTTTETAKPTTTKTEPSSGEGEEEATTPATENPVELKPDGTYYYRRNAKLTYELNLQFDLSTITQTIERLSEGDTSSVESFAAAGFGLQAGFDIQGFEKIQTNMTEGEASGNSRQLTKAAARGAGAFSYQDANFAVDSFYREASRVHRSINESARGAHRKAVTQFSARYRLDNQFSMSFGERFNTQTERVAADMPSEVANYVGSAGKLAAGGTTGMMNAFFDAVDSYLDGSEQKLLDNVTAFFDQAAADLGFEGAMVDAARTDLTDSITSFFDSVQAAVDQLGTWYAPEVNFSETAPAVQPIASPDLALLDAIDNSNLQPTLVEQLLEASA